MKFKDLLFSVADQCIPKTSLSTRKRNHWLSEDTLRMIRKKKRPFKLAKRSRLEKDFRKYRDISNRLRSLTTRDHRDHLEEITKDLSTDPRPFWRWLKNARDHCPRLPDLHLAGRVISSGKEKADAFGEYFRSVFTQEDINSLRRLEEELVVTRSEVKIEEVVLTENEVYEELRRIDPGKASGPDEIPGRLLREGAPWIASPLYRLFKASLDSGSLPEEWTRANITPVFTKGNNIARRTAVQWASHAW